jgi:outer membrane lipoprotein SlyB
MDKTQIIRLVLGISIGAVLGGIMGYFGKCVSGTCPLTATPWRGAVYGAVMGALISFALDKK